MTGETRISFDAFSLDRANECLWRGAHAIKLRPKAFAVLNHLIGRSGQLVTKEELLNTVWSETFVGDAVLKVTIRQLRKALNDNSSSPRFIETAHRRGYRFIGQIGETGHLQVQDQESTHVGLAQRTGYQSAGVVGRDDALSLLQRSLRKMRDGERQIVFVTGEAGIGKTALIDAFAHSFNGDGVVRVARGQCLEQYGTGEAYLPVLEAIGRLCREHDQVLDVLRAHAPMWLLQLPSVVSRSERESLSREISGATRERMLREMGDALEAVTAESPLVLILEDLHWSDYSTLDLISYLANQRQRAQLMLIGTYRPVELIVSGHPLKAVKQELLAKQQCEELPLNYLNEEAVGTYLRLRFAENRFPAALASLIHNRTEGNPLFMVNAVDYLLAEKSIVEREHVWELVAPANNVEQGVPDSIRQMIEKQVDHLDAEDQRLLEAASVAGLEFSSLAVVAALEDDRATVEARCDELVRRHHFLHDCGVHELPNGEAVSRYGFIHVLYQNVLYDRTSPSRRVQLHRRIADRGEEVYGDRAGDIAAELAMHFERGRDYKRTAKYLQRAADKAIRRFAYQEAVPLARHGLETIARMPDSSERAEQELCLQLTLGVPLIATEGYAAEDVGNVYVRARELCRQIGDTPDVSEALWGLWTFHMLKAELSTARDIAEEFLSLAERLPYHGLALRGHWALEIVSLHQGEFEKAIEHCEKALSLYEPKLHVDDAFLYALNPGVAVPCFAGWALWFLGLPDQAPARIEEALVVARQLSEPQCLAHALFFAAFLYQLLRDERRTQEYAEATIDVSRVHGLVMYEAMALIIRGWVLFEQQRTDEAIEQMRQGLAALEETNTDLVRPQFLALLAEALGKTGRANEGLRLMEQALELVDRKGERYYHAELYRLKGELLLVQSGDVSAAADCFRQAIEVAQEQKAKSWELRAAMSLARLHVRQNEEKQALDLLAPVYDSFSEGFDTLDLREAKALLRALSNSDS